jgi:hypothetical protein
MDRYYRQKRAALRWAEVPDASRVLDHKTRLGANRMRRTPPNDAARAGICYKPPVGRRISSPEWSEDAAYGGPP